MQSGLTSFFIAYCRTDGCSNVSDACRCEKLIRRVIALSRECGTRRKKRVINLSPVWANSNQSVQILESISSAASSALSLFQPITSLDATIAHADNENFYRFDIIARRLRFFLRLPQKLVDGLLSYITRSPLLSFSLVGWDTCSCVAVR